MTPSNVGEYRIGGHRITFAIAGLARKRELQDTIGEESHFIIQSSYFVRQGTRAINNPQASERKIDCGVACNHSIPFFSTSNPKDFKEE